MSVIISSPGLAPSNKDAGFPNLARRENPTEEVIAEVTAITEAELRASGIRVANYGIVWTGEVPTKAMGELSMWGFRRCWYYWSAKGPGLPVEIAEKLHATHGTQVRVDGHCGCPSPREWFKGFGVGRYHIDTPEGLKALADALLSIYTEAANGKS